MKNDELIYGGCSFTPSSVVNLCEEDFIIRHSDIWKGMEKEQRDAELEHVYKVCQEMVKESDAPAPPAGSQVKVVEDPPPPPPPFSGEKSGQSEGKPGDNAKSSGKKDDKGKN